MLIFDLTPHLPLGGDIAQVAGHPLCAVETRDFKGGQHKLRPLVSVRGGDVFVIAALHATGGLSVNDHLVRMLFFIAACRDHGAVRVTAVVPCLPYARKDRVTKARDPVSSRYVAQLFEAVGTDTLITVDVHNLAAFQNGFRCRTINLDTVRLFSAAVMDRAGDAPVTILSPDLGGAKRAERLRQSVELVCNRPAGFAVVEKHRSGGVTSGELFAGEVADHDVWIVDDMIESGETMLRAAEACRLRGARSVRLMATHALLDGAAMTRLLGAAITSLTVTDTTGPITPPAPGPRLCQISVAPMIGQCLARMHNGQAISPVLDPTGLSR
ncbi:ribose-phosphate pyrophosphokinase [Cypionkella sp.]|uniref:ribose-phosphate diphosphokinase n=1 Tax=Cypionkella sp. TaxID=2811411 RepID=UPI00271FA985|nr:ribose-phosphate diphosphokinase [Cypionkella sp.]MDO8985982.1 ribose-phosphate diphosphokinase [Cypionkella sp.]MDP2048170.1 ribose-phosphate diphosphokinase [Cypionkella sp.]